MRGPVRRVMVRAGSRLHAGFHTIGDHERGVEYAGAGFYIEEPSTVVEAEECDTTRVEAPDEHRKPVLDALERIGAGRACLRVLQAPPRHVGLGSTTQVMLSTAIAVLALEGRVPASPGEVVRLGVEVLGRHEGSTVGAHLFAYGGFILDPGVPPARGAQAIRLEVPEDWVFIVVQPRLDRGVPEGGVERRLLSMARPGPAARRLMSEGLRLLLLGLMRRSLETLLDGLRMMQSGTGQAFARVQGGTYRRDLAAIVDEAQRDGIVLAQSSWGPTLYTITRAEWAESDAKTLRMILSEHGVPGRVWVSRPRNRGYEIVPGGDGSG